MALRTRLWLWLLAAAVACSDPVATSPPDAASDGVAREPDAVLGGFDLKLPGVDAALNCPGGSGCACAANVDCDNALCIETPAGKRCAQNCATSCANGFQCVQTTSTSGDVATICVPSWGKLCNPCVSSQACAALGQSAASCVVHGDSGAYCGADCAKDGDCPPDFFCGELPSIEGPKGKQCVPKGGNGNPVGVCACSPAAIDAGLGTNCTAKAKDGSGGCPGQRNCGPAGLSVCSGPEFSAEVCDGIDNDCDGITDESTCPADTPCTKNICNAKLKKCESSVTADGITCNDGSACSVSEKCAGGSCTGVALDCDDKNACSTDACDLVAGCSHTPADGTGCEDDNPCTIGDICKLGACTSGKPKVCTVDQQCTVVACALASGKCEFGPSEDGLLCDDGTLCSEKDACVAGKCKGKPVSCDDNSPCTNDGCDSKSGCTHTPTKAPCDDVNACTDSDICKDGVCVGLAKSATACDDSNPCTKDGCELATGCTHTASEGACNADSTVCTANDLCVGAICTAGKKVDCDDKNGCSNDSCDPVKGCVYVANSEPCDADGSACTANDNCADKNCAAGKAVVCNDSNPCTLDTCDPKTGKCDFAGLPKDTTPCDADGTVCTDQDACSGGVCTVGKKLVCNDANGCTNDGCNKVTGCTFVGTTALCDADGSLCTKNDVCANSTCVAGPLTVCDDKKLCTKDSCDPKSGQCGFDALAYNGQLCDADGSVCTDKDACLGGVCSVGKPISCDDNNPCSTDTCDVKTGCGYAKVADDTTCGNGLVCKVGVCQGASACNYAIDVVYGGPADDGGRKVIAVPGGYAIAATTQSNFGAATDAWLVRLNDAGKLMWTAAFGGTGADSITDVEATGGGYITVGTTASKGAGGSDLWLARFDSGGGAMWELTAGGTEDDSGAAVVAVTDGFVAAGTTTEGGQGKAMLFKADLAGKKVWSTTVGPGAFVDVAATSGGYVALGSVESKGAGQSDFWLVRTDLAGQPMWDKTFGGAKADQASAIVAFSDGLLLVGSTLSSGAGSQDLWVVRTDTAGTKLWDHTYGGVGIETGVHANSIADGWVLIGSVQDASLATEPDLLLLRIDSIGNLLAIKTMGDSGEEIGRSVLPIKDGYAITGSTGSKGAGARDLWFMRTDPWFNTSCPPAKLCGPLLPAACNDANKCTLDWCDSAKGCTNTPGPCTP